VKIKRGGSKELLEFTIERDKIPIYSLDASYMAAPKVGYVKLNNFSATTVDEVKKAVRELRSEGMEDLIIDLQSNGGGYLMTAINLVDELLDDDKLVVYTQGRTYPRNSYGTRHKGGFEKGRLIVLVNESSASASEIVSGAIQDWDRGLIVGRRSFGKGLVQKPIYLTDGTQVRITTQRYYTPSGRCIQKSYENGTREYRKEKYERYSSGESFNKDSIHFIDSLKFETKVKNRTVYGGGGIMPDVFVPLDTNGTSKYYSSLIRKGIMNRFALTWVNKNREKLESKYISFDKFKSNFKTEKVMKELFEYAEEEGLEYNEEQFLAAEKTIKTRLKANIAQNLYDYRKFYEIINELNSSLQEALKILKEGDEFNQLSAN
jgi:carboxyl-terminal processing protease